MRTNIDSFTKKKDCFFFSEAGSDVSLSFVISIVSVGSTIVLLFVIKKNFVAK